MKNILISFFGLTMLMSLFSQQKTIKEVYIIHNTHCDYGFTDYPETNIRQHVDFLKQALQYCAETEKYPLEARFHWTVENMWTLENFWNSASDAEKKAFDKYFKLGQIEVMAMPANFTMLPKAELEREINRLSFFYKKYKPVTVMQNDVNGIPWGLIPLFKKHGFNYVWMGLNNYGSKAPRPVPNLWNWQGPDNQKILTWQAYKYSDGYDWFHREWWRKGPVPVAHDVWFNPPVGNETFDTSPANLDTAAIFVKKFKDKLQADAYPYSAVAITVTNMWRCDNDPPVRQLSDFIAAWNKSGRTPRLIFATPQAFFNKISPEMNESVVETVRGDWSDWWADGLPGLPAQIATLQDARRRNEDILNVLSAHSEKSQLQSEALKNNKTLLYCMEHTFDSYNSVAQPYGEVTLNNEYHRFNEIYKGQELSKMLKSDIIRNSPQYSVVSKTRFMEVFNPGTEVRSGRVSISADALRYKANAVKDVVTQKIYPLEKQYGYEWTEPFAEKERPLEFPDNVWGAVLQQYYFYIDDLKAGEKRKFELIETTLPENNAKANTDFVINKQSSKPFINVTLDNQTVFDPTSPYFPGQLVIEKSVRFKDRFYVENRKPEAEFLRILPEVVRVTDNSDFYAIRKTVVYKSDVAKSIVQDFALIKETSQLDITTTLWLNEILDPTAMYMAFPFANVDAAPFYYSAGYATQVGKDQLPHSCGEYAVIQDGVWYRGDKKNVVLHTPDNPLMGFEDIYTRRFKEVFEPTKPIAFSMLFNNYWVTNFPIIKPVKVVFRHSVQLQDKTMPVNLNVGKELWAYPVK